MLSVLITSVDVTIDRGHSSEGELTQDACVTAELGERKGL